MKKGINKKTNALKKLKYELMKILFLVLFLTKKQSNPRSKKDKVLSCCEVVKVYEKNTIMGLEVI